MLLSLTLETINLYSSDGFLSLPSLSRTATAPIVILCLDLFYAKAAKDRSLYPGNPAVLYTPGPRGKSAERLGSKILLGFTTQISWHVLKLRFVHLVMNDCRL